MTWLMPWTECKCILGLVPAREPFVPIMVSNLLWHFCVLLLYSDENSMTAEQIEHIIEYLPSMEERKLLEQYMLEGGQDAAQKFDSLCECEKFMVSMMTVKHAKSKVRALLFKLQFESCLEALAKGKLVGATFESLVFARALFLTLNVAYFHHE